PGGNTTAPIVSNLTGATPSFSIKADANTTQAYVYQWANANLTKGKLTVTNALTAGSAALEVMDGAGKSLVKTTIAGGNTTNDTKPLTFDYDGSAGNWTIIVNATGILG